MLPASRKMVGSLVFAAIWVAIAAIRPTSTFHLAPLIVAAWPGLGERDLSRALPLSLAGGVVAAGTTGLLLSVGWLRGPSLLPWGGPELESLVVMVAGVLVGLLPAIVGRLRARER